MLRRQIWFWGQASPYCHSVPCLDQHANSYTSMSTLFGILTGNTPHAHTHTHADLITSGGVMGDEDVSCHFVQDREWFNPHFIIRGVADNWTPAPQSEQIPRTKPFGIPLSWLQASKPITFLFYLHMVFVSFDVDSYTWGGRDFSKNDIVVVYWFPAPTPPLSLSFSRLQELLNGISWTASTLQLKIPEGVLIYKEASSPGALQTLSHLSLKTPCKVGCGQRTLSQRGKEGFERKGQQLGFYSEVHQANPVLSLRFHSLHFHLGIVRVHLKQLPLAQRKRPGLSGFWTPRLLLLGDFASIFSLKTGDSP